MKILCLCDSLTTTTGFAKVATNLINRWTALGAEVHIWGIGFLGYKYREHPNVLLMPAGTGRQQDHWASLERLSLFLGQLQVGGYTHVWIMQDTFLLVGYDFPRTLRRLCREHKIRSLLYFPVDAPLEPGWTDILAAVDVPVAYTEFGRAEAKKKLARRKADIRELNTRCDAEGKPEAKLDMADLNYDVEVKVLPHGVDPKIFHPLEDRAGLRKNFWKSEWLGPEDFLLVNVNVNQRRKDVTRSLEILSGLKAKGVPAKLVMHMRRTSESGLNLLHVGNQLGLEYNRDWTDHDPVFTAGSAHAGFSEAQMCQLYNIADLYLTTSLGEGWGLGITEALACGTPVALPCHTSCGEIGQRAGAEGLEQNIVLLPGEPGHVVQESDNSRLRQRVDLPQAIEAIGSYWSQGLHKKRPPLSPTIRQWLDWDRIAGAMLEWMKG